MHNGTYLTSIKGLAIELLEKTSAERVGILKNGARHTLVQESALIGVHPRPCLCARLAIRSPRDNPNRCPVNTGVHIRHGARQEFETV